MVFFNYALRKLNAKIVYYGPGLCGKTTNLQWIHDHFEGGQRGKMISLATEGDRTIFFDLLPIDIGTIRGMEVTLQLYTVPGQVHYNSTRQLVLRGADGVVFVADSQRTMQQSNDDSFKNLEENLMLQGIELKDFPHVLQFNKRDLRDLQSVEELDTQLNNYRVPIFEAVATEGVGVQETLEGIVKLVMRSLRERYEPKMAAGPKPVSAPTPAGTGWPAPAPAPAPTAPGPEPPSAPAQTVPPPRTAPPPAAPSPPRPPTGASAFRPPPEAEVPDETPTDVVGRQAPVYPDGEVTRDRQADLLIDEPTGTDHLVDELPDASPTAEPDEPTHVRSPSTDDGPIDGPGAAFEPPSEDPFTAGPSRDASFVDDVDGTATDVGTLVPDGEDQVLGGAELESLEPLEPLEPFEPIEVPPADGPDTPLEPGDAVEFDSGARAERPDSPSLEFRDEIRAPSPFVRPAASESTDTDFAQAWPPPPDASGGEAPAEDFEIGTSWELESGDQGPPRESTSDAAAARQDQPTFDASVGPVAAGHDAAAEGGPGSESSGPVDTTVATETPTARPQQSADGSPATAARPPRAGGVDDLVASVLGREPAGEAPRSPEVEPGSAEVRPPADAEGAAAPPPWERSRRGGTSQPVTVGDGDPFAAEEDETPAPPVTPAPITPRPHGPVSVEAHDNQLHLRLQGTGAIAESGQVRELDIQVPVPGSWVGNRRVTLQLRLTLMPASEDEDGGEG